MIQWRNTAAEVGPRPLEALVQTLSCSDVLRLVGALGEAGSGGPLVIVPDSLRERVFAHGRQSRDELGGLLIGEAFVDGGRGVAVVRLREAVWNDDYTSTAVSLRLDSSIWMQARGHLAAGRLVVGWYHTHPNLGAFFSGTDRRTQRAFFAHPYSVGWVIDPYAAGRDPNEKFFLGPDAVEITAPGLIAQRA